MIITRIQSENFLKYRHLDLTDLPKQGLITVGGRNESGKSSIGETLCFGLFGRTFTLELDAPRKLIRWGESRCSVSIEFLAKDAKRYVVSRYLDNEGGYGARLLEADSDRLLAKGGAEVDRRIVELIGFGYDEFIESFYLAQRELTTPHPHSHTIKVMAGIAPLTAVSEEIEAAKAREQEDLEKTRNNYFTTESEYHDLDLDQNWYPKLQASQEQIESRRGELQQVRQALQEKSKQYQARVVSIWRGRRAKAALGLLSVLLFVVAVTAWVVWATLRYLPDTAQGMALGQWLQAHISQWETVYWPTLLPTAIGSSIGFLLLQLAVWRVGQRTTQYRSEASELSPVLQQVVETLNAPALQFIDAVTALFPSESPPAAADRDAGPIAQRTARAMEMLAVFKATPTQIEDLSHDLDLAILAQDEGLLAKENALEEAMAAEVKRLETGRGLQQIKTDLNTQIGTQLHQIQVYDNALYLLRSTAHHLSHRFNQSVLNLAGQALPVFTQGRYKHLKIDDKLDVRVFSNEKRDFMDFDETSSGTQRQVMLSLRLAMSQELIKNIQCSPQFIFFDEPFAFFDQQRIKSTLEELPHISSDLAQIWLVAQEFPEGTKADYQVHCTHETEELLVTSALPDAAVDST